MHPLGRRRRGKRPHGGVGMRGPASFPRRGSPDLHTRIRSWWCIGLRMGGKHSPLSPCSVVVVHLRQSCIFMWTRLQSPRSGDVRSRVRPCGWRGFLGAGGRGNTPPSLPPQVPSIHRTYARAARKPRHGMSGFPCDFCGALQSRTLSSDRCACRRLPSFRNLENPLPSFSFCMLAEMALRLILSNFSRPLVAPGQQLSFNHRRRYHPKQSKPIHNPRV